MRTIKSNRTLGREIVRLLQRIASAVPIWLLSLLLCCAGSTWALVTIGRPALPVDLWSCVEFGLYFGLVATPIVAICGVSASRQIAYRIVLIGSLICSILAAWCFHRFAEAMASI